MMTTLVPHRPRFSATVTVREDKVRQALGADGLAEVHAQAKQLRGRLRQWPDDGLKVTLTTRDEVALPFPGDKNPFVAVVDVYDPKADNVRVGRNALEKGGRETLPKLFTRVQKAAERMAKGAGLRKTP